MLQCRCQRGEAQNISRGIYFLLNSYFFPTNFPNFPKIYKGIIRNPIFFPNKSGTIKLKIWTPEGTFLVLHRPSVRTSNRATKTSCRAARLLWAIRISDWDTGFLFRLEGPLPGNSGFYWAIGAPGAPLGSFAGLLVLVSLSGPLSSLLGYRGPF